MTEPAHDPRAFRSSARHACVTRSGNETGVRQKYGVERVIDAAVPAHFTFYLELGVNGHISKAKTARRGPLRRGCFYTGIPFPLRKYDGKGESGDQDNV